jgi:hypothetical protein
MDATRVASWDDNGSWWVDASTFTTTEEEATDGRLPGSADSFCGCIVWDTFKTVAR